MGTIVLAQHCQTDWNANHRIQGHRPIPLNQEGIRQANVLGSLLKKDDRIDIRHIFCSDLTRAVETAEIIWRLYNSGPSFRIDADLRECCFGSLEGKTNEQVHLEHRFNPRETRSGEYDFSKYGGETRGQVVRRLQQFLARIRTLTELTKPSVLIVSHGRTLGTLIRAHGGEDRLEQGSYQLLDLNESFTTHDSRG